MTEKRFTIHNRGLQGQFIKESGEFLTVDMACEMLNDFYEENEELNGLLTEIVGITTDFRKEVFEQELLEAIDSVDSLDELKSMVKVGRE